MNNRFGGVIWTNHALERLNQRGISQSDAFVTFDRPDDKRYAATKGAWVCTKKVGRQLIEIVTSQNERKEWVIMSVWSKPIYGLSYRENFLTDFLEKIVQKVLTRLFGKWQKKFSKGQQG
jgi:GR25 family glycosyltransferase involved in LPS biosynthesis